MSACYLDIHSYLPWSMKRGFMSLGIEYIFFSTIRVPGAELVASLVLYLVTKYSHTVQ